MASGFKIKIRCSHIMSCFVVELLTVLLLSIKFLCTTLSRHCFNRQCPGEEGEGATSNETKHHRTLPKYICTTLHGYAPAAAARKFR